METRNRSEDRDRLNTSIDDGMDIGHGFVASEVIERSLFFVTPITSFF